jgi:hypothetical protein
MGRLDAIIYVDTDKHDQRRLPDTHVQERGHALMKGIVCDLEGFDRARQLEFQRCTLYHL